MKLLTRLATLLGTLVLSGVALTGTAFAMQPHDPSGGSGVPASVPAVAPPSNAAPSIVHTVGLSTLQVVGLMLCAAVLASLLTAFLLHRPHLHASS